MIVNEVPSLSLLSLLPPLSLSLQPFKSESAFRWWWHYLVSSQDTLLQTVFAKAVHVHVSDVSLLWRVGKMGKEVISLCLCVHACVRVCICVLCVYVCVYVYMYVWVGVRVCVSLNCMWCTACTCSVFWVWFPSFQSYKLLVHDEGNEALYTPQMHWHAFSMCKLQHQIPTLM